MIENYRLLAVSDYFKLSDFTNKVLSIEELQRLFLYAQDAIKEKFGAPLATTYFPYYLRVLSKQETHPENSHR